MNLKMFLWRVKVWVLNSFYWWVNSNIYPGLRFREYLRISKLPRDQKGVATLNGKKILYADGIGFLGNVKELFSSNSYFFKTENSTPLIIDCGAYIGLSVIYFKSLYPNAHVIAFEADPNIYNVLKQNIENYELKDVEIINKALWNEETELTFFSENNMSGSVMVNDGQKGKPIKVPTVRLGTYLQSPIDLLKIDIEGAEGAVLKDIKNQLHQVQRIFIEYHSVANKQQELDELLQILRNAGFRYYIHDAYHYAKRPFEGLKSEGFDLQLNIFGVR